jgi:hypothetical protein
MALGSEKPEERFLLNPCKQEAWSIFAYDWKDKYFDPSSQTSRSSDKLSSLEFLTAK